MTIKGMNSFLKAKVPAFRRSVPVAFFAGTKVAIDAYECAYAFMSTSLGHEAKKIIHTEKLQIDQAAVTRLWLGRFLTLITIFLEAGLTPVFVFDGETPPEKGRTREKRKAEKEAARSELEALKASLTREDLLADTAARERIAKLYARDILITPEQHTRLWALLTAIGIPLVKASGEGEALCAQLVKDGICSAMYSEDSDAGAYAAPRVITKIDRPSYVDEQLQQTCTATFYNPILQKLKLTQSQFLDLCIMAGTDFNANIPNWGVGKCYKLLEQFGSIEAIPAAKLDVTPLNHVRIREIFTTLPRVVDGTVEVRTPDPELGALLTKNGLLRSGQRLCELLQLAETQQLIRDLAEGECGVSQLTPDDLLELL